MLKQATIPRFDFQPESIAGKAVLITGGTTGIGRATALLLAGRGARVLIFGRHQTELQDALADINPAGDVCGLVADQARHGDVRRVFREVDESLYTIRSILCECRLHLPWALVDWNRAQGEELGGQVDGVEEVMAGDVRFGYSCAIGRRGHVMAPFCKMKSKSPKTLIPARVRARGLLKALGGLVGIGSLWLLGLMRLLGRLTKDQHPSEAAGLLAMVMSVPFVFFCIAVIETLTGRPFRRLSSAWDQMSEWRQGVFSFLLFCLGIGIVGLILYLVVLLTM
jgi:short subunit dehydrogenase